MNLSEYKKHESWTHLKDLYITDAHIKDWGEFTGINPNYKMLFEVEGAKFNAWIFKNFVWFVEFVVVQFLDIQENGATGEIPDDLEIINSQLRNAPAILARLNQMHCEIDASYRSIAGVIWKACPDHYTIDDKKHEQMYFVSYLRMVRKKIEKAIGDTIERINILKKAQDKALVDYQVQASAIKRSQITGDKQN